MTILTGLRIINCVLFAAAAGFVALAGIRDGFGPLRVATITLLLVALACTVAAEVVHRRTGGRS